MGGRGRLALRRRLAAGPHRRSRGGRPYSVETLAAQIGHAVDATGAERLVLDSLNAVLSLHEDVAAARQLLRSLISSLRGMGLTVVLTVETPGDPGGTLSRYGVEEFVADNVVLLRNVREGAFRRRTARGAQDARRHAPQGRRRVHRPARPRPGRAARDRAARGARPAAPSGCRPGTPGSTGSRTAACCAGAARCCQDRPAPARRCSPPSSPPRARRTRREGPARRLRGDRASRCRATAPRSGTTSPAYERAGLLHVVSLYPEVASLDDHLVEVRDLVERLRPSRLVIDSLSRARTARVGARLPRVRHRAHVVRQARSAWPPS